MLYLLEMIKLKVLLKRSTFGKVGSKKSFEMFSSFENFIIKNIFYIKYWFPKNILDFKAVLDLKAQEEFAELSSDSNLKLQFQNKPLTEFWIGTRTEFPTIADMALNVLLSFNTTYLCEVTSLANTN